MSLRTNACLGSLFAFRLSSSSFEPAPAAISARDLDGQEGDGEDGQDDHGEDGHGKDGQDTREQLLPKNFVRVRSVREAMQEWWGEDLEKIRSRV